MLTADDLAGLGVIVLAIAVVLVPVYVLAAVRRARARRAHADVSRTGAGRWDAVLEPAELDWFFPDARPGFVASSFLTLGVPVSLELDSQGLRLRPTTRWVRRAGQVWSAPWREVIGAAETRVGFRAFGGKLSTVPLTDVRITTAGASARLFLDWWDPHDEGDEPDDEPDPEWDALVRAELGADWRPGTAVLRLRTSAPDGLVEAVRRWARGSAPA